MRWRPEHQQQELFEEEEPPIALSFEQRLQLRLWCTDMLTVVS
jgi:hypothetical protein